MKRTLFQTITITLPLFLFLFWPFQPAWSQSESTPSSPTVQGGGGGGGGGADFTELMTLIQQTIDPDAWIDNSSVMSPFPSGVYIDPLGQLRHVSSSTVALPASHNHSPKSNPHLLRQAWRTPSTLRIVSLRQLDRALSKLATGGLRATQEFEQLAGLSRIEFVQVDVANEDILLAGPASGDRANAAPGFHLVDLALLVELISTRSSPLGCSIDPTDDGIRAAQQLLAPAGALKRLAINPQKFVGQMQDAIGPHHVRVFGMPAGSPAAIALITADEHMKQLGFGTAQTPVAIKSYFDHLDQQADVPAESLIRWWFTFADEPIQADPKQNLFQLPRHCVALLSEQQWVSQQGRKSTGKHDLAADAFAAGMTDSLDQLRQAHPDYARMCALFELALSLQVALEASQQQSLQAWFPQLRQLGQLAEEPLAEPKTVSGLSAWHRTKQGTVVAVVSGGVQINARQLAIREHWQSNSIPVDLPTASTSVESSHAHWWWD